MARISKGDFGKRHCNTEMSTVIPIDLKSGLHLEQIHLENSYQKEKILQAPSTFDLFKVLLLSNKIFSRKLSRVFPS